MKLFGFNPADPLYKDQTEEILSPEAIEDYLYQSFEVVITHFFDKLTTGKCNNCKNNRI